MKIHNVGYNYRHDQSFRINRPYGSGDYIFLVIRCRAVFELKGTEVHVPENSVLLFKKGTPQIYSPEDNEFVNDWIHFDLDPNELAELLDMGIPLDSPIHVENTVYFSELIQDMYREQYSANIYKDTSMELFARLLFIKLSERIRAMNLSSIGPKTVFVEQLSQLRTRIYSSPAMKWTVSSMAEELSLSQSYFQHLYKNMFGVSVMVDVINSRVEFAKYLLISTDYSISTVAEACGYRNDVHFMRQFKEIQSMTTSDYRKEYRVSPEELHRGTNKPPFNIQINVR